MMRKLSILATLVIVLVLVVKSSGADDLTWSYDDAESNGPSNWANIEPKCGGKEQSPINIVSNSAVEMEFEPLAPGAPAIDHFLLSNTGNTLRVETVDNVALMTLSGADLKATYRCVFIEDHWGEKCGQGSQHQIDRLSYPMEIDFVFVNENFQNLEDAIASGESDAVLITAVFVDISDSKPPTPVDHVADFVRKIIHKGDKDSVRLPYSKLRMPIKMDSFYRYHGSLYFPPCEQQVEWIVYSQPVYVSEEKLNIYRELKSATGKAMLNNFRPVQELNDRTVYKTKGLVPVLPRPCKA